MSGFGDLWEYVTKMEEHCHNMTRDDAESDATRQAHVVAVAILASGRLVAGVLHQLAVAILKEKE